MPAGCVRLSGLHSAGYGHCVMPEMCAGRSARSCVSNRREKNGTAERASDVGVGVRVCERRFDECAEDVELQWD